MKNKRPLFNIFEIVQGEEENEIGVKTPVGKSRVNGFMFGRRWYWREVKGLREIENIKDKSYSYHYGDKKIVATVHIKEFAQSGSGNSI